MANACGHGEQHVEPRCGICLAQGQRSLERLLSAELRRERRLNARLRARVRQLETEFVARRKPIPKPRLSLEITPVVYFARRTADGLIKIGSSADVTTRINDLRVGAGPVELLATLAGDYAREIEIHARFACDRVHGEWFKPSPELLAFIAEAAA